MSDDLDAAAQGALALHGRLLAEVERLRAGVLGGPGEVWVPVVRGIVESHAPIRMQSYANPGTPRLAMFCGGCAGLCHSRSGLYCDCPEDSRYPCVDVRAIAGALNIDLEVSG